MCCCLSSTPFALYPFITAAALQHSRTSIQMTCHPCDLFTQARSIKSTYDAFVTAVAAKTGGDVRLASLKSMWRIAEKIVLRSPEEQRGAPGACKIRDVVRGAILFTHVGSMYSALDVLVGCDDALLRKQVCFLRAMAEPGAGVCACPSRCFEDKDNILDVLQCRRHGDHCML